MELAVVNLWMYKCYYSFRRALGAAFRLLWDLDCLVLAGPLPFVRGLAHSARGVG
jgi:hypothetical protein